MFHPLPIAIGMRYLRGRSGDKFGRFVSYMSMAGITIGVMSLITVLSVMNGFEGQLKSRMLGVLPHAVLTHNDANKMKASVLLTEFSSWSDIVQTSPLLSSDAVVQSAHSLSAGRLLGVDPNAYEPISSFIFNGEFSSITPHSYHIVLGRKLARDLGVTVGDKVRVMVTSASQFTPVGRIPSQRNFIVAGVYDTATDVDGQLMYVNIDDLSRLMKLDADKPYDLRLYLSDPFDVHRLSVQAQAQGYEWSDWRELRGEFFQAVKMEKNIMGLMLGLIILVAVFNIITALIMVVMEKQSEIAILKTQGMPPKHIVMIFITQGATSGIIGALLGGILGCLLALNINELMAFFNLSMISGHMELPISLQVRDVLLIVFGAIGLSLLVTLYPSYRAASLLPAEVLRYE